MGFFSFKTSDTNRSIANHYSKRKTFNVVMQDDKGNVWYENDYEGYGVFGGKDIYELISEMNGYGKNRVKGIHLHLGISGIKNLNTNKIYLSCDVDFFNWGADKLENNMSANELLETGDWVSITVKDKNVKFPMLNEVEQPNWFNTELKDCKYQGYFY